MKKATRPTTLSAQYPRPTFAPTPSPRAEITVTENNESIRGRIKELREIVSLLEGEFDAISTDLAVVRIMEPEGPETEKLCVNPPGCEIEHQIHCERKRIELIVTNLTRLRHSLRI